MAVAGKIYDATFGRLFTAWYGTVIRRVDELGLREVRREVLAGATGRTLDVGTGTGSNLPLFPSRVDQLVLAEPDRHMREVLSERLVEAEAQSAELIAAPAERLPFGDASFDCVTCTMVLCTVPDPGAALNEMARVLKPGGKLLFLEHVRSEDPFFAKRQDRMEKPWRFVADGCHCNRDSLAAIEASPFAVEELKRGVMPGAPMFMKPLIYGSAGLNA
jgi:ubiquinone/menaquinone biosynthesis C-methylase UbiE